VAAAGEFSSAYCALGFIIPVAILEIRDFKLSRSSSSGRGREGGCKFWDWDSKGPWLRISSTQRTTRYAQVHGTSATG
jgi:hypothetical protein